MSLPGSYCRPGQLAGLDTTSCSRHVTGSAPLNGLQQRLGGGDLHHGGARHGDHALGVLLYVQLGRLDLQQTAELQSWHD